MCVFGPCIGPDTRKKCAVWRLDGPQRASGERIQVLKNEHPSRSREIRWVEDLDVSLKLKDIALAGDPGLDIAQALRVARSLEILQPGVHRDYHRGVQRLGDRPR